MKTGYPEEDTLLQTNNHTNCIKADHHARLQGSAAIRNALSEAVPKLAYNSDGPGKPPLTNKAPQHTCAAGPWISLPGAAPAQMRPPSPIREGLAAVFS